MHTNELLDLVRSLQTDFEVLQRTDDALVLAVDQVRISGSVSPAVFRFAFPKRSWAMRWNAVKREWENTPELSTPNRGKIAKAFIKSAGRGFTLSLSDEREPLVRWGFTTTGITVEPAIDGCSFSGEA